MNDDNDSVDNHREHEQEYHEDNSHDQDHHLLGLSVRQVLRGRFDVNIISTSCCTGDHCKIIATTSHVTRENVYK